MRTNKNTYTTVEHICCRLKWKTTTLIIENLYRQPCSTTNRKTIKDFIGELEEIISEIMDFNYGYPLRVK